MEQHEFALTAQDLEAIEYALIAFFLDGPDIHYARLHASEPPGPSYRTLMTSTTVGGGGHSYLWSEDNFAFVKQLQSRNLIVPLIGDFGGTGALRRTGDYIRQHRRSGQRLLQLERRGLPESREGRPVLPQPGAAAVQLADVVHRQQGEAAAAVEARRLHRPGHDEAPAALDLARRS